MSTGSDPIPPRIDARVRAFQLKRTYRNERYGFEIDVPRKWRYVPGLGTGPVHALERSSDVSDDKEAFRFICGEEVMSVVIAAFPFLPDLQAAERAHLSDAQGRRATERRIGKIVVGDTAHRWVSYHVRDKYGEYGEIWNKTYVLTFGEMQASLTYTCSDPAWYGLREGDIDAIVASSRVVTQAHQSEEHRDGDAVRPADQFEELVYGDAAQPADEPEELVYGNAVQSAAEFEELVGGGTAQPAAESDLANTAPVRKATLGDILAFVAALVVLAGSSVAMIVGRLGFRSAACALGGMAWPALLLIGLGPKLGLSRRSSAGLAVFLYAVFVFVLLSTD